ncbi:aldo/keto reductase [Terrilactibacillus sp. S3-3]|nr:aldo/keto reductase [Terrilactibacillus sp. S3-3]
MESLSDRSALNNGVEMPRIGLGVYKTKDGDEVIRAVQAALQTGYPSIDTAAFYQNETGVGEGIRRSGLSRQELFVTTKVWNSDQGYEPTLRAFQTSLEKLGLSYLDLYLIHWPIKGKLKETWRAMEKLYKEGYVRAIGVCNFKPRHLDELLADCEYKPAVNQIELHPRLTQEKKRAYCYDHQIRVEAWSPLMKGRLFDNPVIVRIADQYQKTPAQVIVRWDLQHGIITIPKSIHPERIRQNADVFDFELAPEDMDALDALNRCEWTGSDPDDVYESGRLGGRS